MKRTMCIVTGKDFCNDCNACQAKQSGPEPETCLQTPVICYLVINGTLVDWFYKAEDELAEFDSNTWESLWLAGFAFID